ncbi:phage tail tube protein [Nonomuraea sediminis]|uniref:phage tail tube protein n=1 Tax=Nonomuraea sediminis TaxID=2835864 RepID=UPI001BDD37C3|nr:hypothetical protein [Nonomuraea sediminis]
MAGTDLLGDGMIKVTICATLSSVSNPPASELNAGIDIQDYIMKDGLGIEPDQASVDNTSLASKSDTERAGTPSYKIEIMGKRKKPPTPDVGYNTLAPGQDVYCAVRRNKDNALPWVAGDEAEVYPVETGIRQKQQTARNEVQKFKSKLFNHTDADIDAVVA